MIILISKIWKIEPVRNNPFRQGETGGDGLNLAHGRMFSLTLSLEFGPEPLIRPSPRERKPKQNQQIAELRRVSLEFREAERACIY